MKTERFENLALKSSKMETISISFLFETKFLLLDAGCAASSKAIQVTEVGGMLVCWVMLSSRRLSVREDPFPVTRLVYLLSSSQVL